MADEDPEQDETPEPPHRLFTLTEAERVRKDLEPFLIEAIDCRKKLSSLENDLAAVSARIMMMGGVIVPYEKLSRLRAEHTHLAETVQEVEDSRRVHGMPVVPWVKKQGLLDAKVLAASPVAPRAFARRRRMPQADALHPQPTWPRSCRRVVEGLLSASSSPAQ